MKEEKTKGWLEKIFSFLFCLFNEHEPDFTTEPPIKCKRCGSTVIPKFICDRRREKL